MKGLTLALWFAWWGAYALAVPDPGMTESKVQSDLEGALSHLISRAQYLVQVSASVDTVTEKRVIEGETTVQTPETTSVVVPPLPGFQPDTSNRVTPPQQSRQTYRMVETPVLRSVQVQLTLDDKLPDETVHQAQSIVQSYLAANYGTKARVVFNRIRMLSPSSIDAPSSGRFPWVWIGLAMLAILTYLWYSQVVQYRRSTKSIGYRSVYDAIAAPGATASSNEAQATLADRPKALALPSSELSRRGSYPALPTTTEFVDQRTKLLDLFLKHSDVFRLYFIRLGDAAQSELYAGLRGPAFDSFLEGLGLGIPARGEQSVSPSEEQMLFYEKNFAEFIQANQWQHNRFFGFLHQLSDEQLVALARQESPLVASLLLKFMRPEQSAYVLARVSSQQRVEILSQSTLLQRISTGELRSIEEAVRARVTQLPKFLVGSAHEDIDFWSKVLSQADNQDEILMDLERTRPEIYPALAKFRFKLEDSPSLPKPLLAKVLDEADNDELALALLTCPKDVVDYLLGEVGQKRRELLLNQLTILNGIGAEKSRGARLAITRRFREVMT